MPDCESEDQATFRARYHELRGAGLSRNAARDVAEAFVKSGLGVNPDAYESRRGPCSSNYGRGSGTANGDSHDMRTSTAKSRKHHGLPPERAELERYAAQVFEGCIRAGLSTEDAHKNALLFVQDVRKGRDSSTLNDFNQMKEALSGNNESYAYSDTKLERESGRGPAMAGAHGTQDGRFSSATPLGSSPGRARSSDSRTSPLSPSSSPWSRGSSGRFAGTAYRTEERAPGCHDGHASDQAFGSVGPASEDTTSSCESPGEWKHSTSYKNRPPGADEASRGKRGNRDQANTPPATDEHSSNSSSSSNRRDNSHRGGSSNSSPACKKTLPTVCLYSVLGVARTASTIEIKRAYRKLSLKWHPDRAQQAGATAKMAEVNQARDVLMDRKQRAFYDQTGRC